MRQIGRAGVRTWLNQRRLDAALRAILLDPGSATIRHLRKALADDEIAATPQELAQWFRSHLGTPIAALPIPARQGTGRGEESRAAGGTTQPPVGASPGGGPREPAGDARANGAREGSGKTYHGATLRDLLDAGLLRPGTQLVLVARGRREAARATLAPSGEIEWEGRSYRSPSDLAFAPLLGVTKFNGWEYWHAELPHGREPLAAVRARMRRGQAAPPEGDPEARAG